MKNFFASFKYAFAGFFYTLKKERNFKVQLFATVMVIAAAFIFKVNNPEWALLIICSVLVLSLEMMNTAIEKICDLLHPEKHPQIKIIKDVAAGAVLLAAIGASIIGLIILLPKLLMYF